MDPKIIDEITRRAISDAKFRELLSTDPESALRQAGYPVEGHEEFLRTLKAATEEHPEALASEYEKSFPGGAGGSSGPMG
jgi:hypothetical protein